MVVSKKSKKSKKNDKTQLDLYSYLYYGIIVSLTLFAFIVSINIQEISMDPQTLVSMNINVSLSNLKILGHIIVLVCYSTFVQYPISKIFHKEILLKKPVKGDKGIRGDRGKAGISGKCEVCSDGLCYKKILFNITNTYNLWRIIKGKSLLPKSYIIKNEFLKDKIKKHCGSKEFKALLTKYGSNKKIASKYMGIYDYLFKMWSLWILIILKYDKGEFFIRSENLSEQDFDGLINEHDSFVEGDTITPSAGGGPKTITPKNFPFFDYGGTLVHIKTIFKDSKGGEYVSTSNPKTLIWDSMFGDEAAGAGGSGAESIKLTKPNIKYSELLEINKMKVETIRNNKINTDYGIDADFFIQKGVPARGEFSPFTEMKRYTAWYWGSDDFTKPDIEIDTSGNKEKDPILKECSNYDDRNKLKIKSTNNYYKIWSSDYALQDKNADGTLTPFKQWGLQKITIIRAHHYIDENAHPKFRTYKPLGDLIIESDKLKHMPFEADRCLPNDIKSDKKILTRIIKNKDNFNTLLVSGDVRPPVRYEPVYSTQRKVGINKNINAFNIWRPIPPTNYKALGYVINTDFNKEPPSTDLIYCVPNNCVKTTPGSPMIIWTNFTNIENEDNDDYVYLYKNTTVTLPNLIRLVNFKLKKFDSVNSDTTNVDIDIEGCKCGDYTTSFTKNTPVPQENKGGIKDKKYSILDIYN